MAEESNGLRRIVIQKNNLPTSDSDGERNEMNMIFVNCKNYEYPEGEKLTDDKKPRWVEVYSYEPFKIPMTKGGLDKVSKPTNGGPVTYEGVLYANLGYVSMGRFVQDLEQVNRAAVDKVKLVDDHFCKILGDCC